MYIHIHQDQECSACGFINYYEYVTRHNWPNHSQTFIRCKHCGHEKEVWSTASDSTGSPVTYQAEQTDERVKF